MEGPLRYLLMDGFVITAVMVVVLGVRAKLHWRPLHIVLGIMLVLTAVFDNLLIVMETFRYVPGHVSGWLIGRAPLEDFAYALVAAILMPAIWEKRRLRAKRSRFKMKL